MEADNIHKPADATLWGIRRREQNVCAVVEQLVIFARNRLACCQHALDSLHLCATQCAMRSEEHTSELQSPCNLACRLLLAKKTQSQSTATTSTADGSAPIACPRSRARA